MSEHEYDASQIKQMTPREHIQHRPQMYIGHDLDTEGLHVLILEIIRESVDPETLNESSKLTVELNEIGAIIINDNGRGLPVTPISFGTRNPTPAFVEVLTWYMKTGTHGYPQYHKAFGFLTYLGCVMSMLSKYLKVETVFEGILYTISLSQGEIIEPLKEIGQTDKKGTRITFLPDPEVFPNLTFDKKRLIEGLAKLEKEFPHVKFNYEGLSDE